MRARRASRGRVGPSRGEPGRRHAAAPRVRRRGRARAGGEGRHRRGHHQGVPYAAAVLRDRGLRRCPRRLDVRPPGRHPLALTGALRPLPKSGVLQSCLVVVWVVLSPRLNGSSRPYSI